MSRDMALSTFNASILMQDVAHRQLHLLHTVSDVHANMYGQSIKLSYIRELQA